MQTCWDDSLGWDGPPVLLSCDCLIDIGKVAETSKQKRFWEEVPRLSRYIGDHLG